MAPQSRSSRQQEARPSSTNSDNDIFLDPMLGSPLQIYVDKDIDDRNAITQLITVRFAQLSNRTPCLTGSPLDSYLFAETRRNCCAWI